GRQHPNDGEVQGDDGGEDDRASCKELGILYVSAHDWLLRRRCCKSAVAESERKRCKVTVFLSARKRSNPDPTSSAVRSAGACIPVIRACACPRADAHVCLNPPE